MVKSFKDCVNFHLLTVFSQDAAEQQKYYIYINVDLKKTSKVTSCQFVDCMEQLNSYCGHLPGLKDSSKDIALTKRIKPFDKAELSQLLLHMCHPKGRDQFNLTQGFIPQSLHSMIEILKTSSNVKNPPRFPGSPTKNLEIM